MALFSSLAAAGVWAADPATQNSDQMTETQIEPSDQQENDDRLDSTHRFVVRHADNIAEWVDGFFGDLETEETAPYSTIRLRLENEWDEDYGNDFKVSLRGKVHLPKLNKRLSLLFSDSDEETSADDLATNKREDSDDVALQYNVSEKDYSRFDIKAGIRSNGNPKGAIKYRYKRPITEKLAGRFSEEVRYRGGDGFGSRTRFQLDRIVSEDKVLRWINRVDWEEEESGIDWGSSVSLDRRIAEDKAFSYYVSIDGNTQPLGRVENYGLGLRYRQSFYKPWLFFEVQPYYQWRKDIDMDSREGVAGLLLQFSAVFEREAKD